MSVGIYDFEKQKKQRVICNAEITVSLTSDRIESINDLVSYEVICKQIEKICAEKHYDLLENLADIIFKTVFKDSKIMNMKLSIEKPDIIEKAESVGIEMFKTNTAHQN